MTAFTIKDVAARAGVSTKTVSRVINGEQHVRADKRETVLRVVAEMDYRPNAFARSLSSSRSYLLGLLIDDPSSGYAADVQLGALMQCRVRSYHLVVEPVDRSQTGWERQLSASLAALKLDGAILTPPLCDDEQLLALLDAAALPYVRISPHGDPDRSGVVQMDDRHAARELTSYLIGLGHRRIGFVCGPPAHAASAERYGGFTQAMNAAGLTVDADLVMDGDFSFRSGLAAGNHMLRSRTLPTAIFAANDDMALGLMMRAMQTGIEIPRQLSIAGFDDAPTARAAWPQLTTIRQPKAEMAAAAVDMLVDPAYRARAGDQHFHRSLAYELVIRGSTAAPVRKP
jgi:LacI family transcriptional regulator